MRKLFDEINSRGIGCPFATFRHQHLHAMQIFQAELLNFCVGLQKRDCIAMIWHDSAEQEESQKKQDMHTSKYLERIYTAYSENGSLVSPHRRFCEKTK